MPTPKNDLQATVEKIDKLVALSASDNVEEARNAAMKAASMIREADLVCIPRKEVEALVARVEGASKAITKAKEAGNRNMMLGAALGFFFGGGKLGK